MNAYSLRGWLVALVAVLVLLNSGVLLGGSYVIVYKQLERKAMQTNEAYAKKMADTANEALEEMQRYLRAKSSAIAHSVDNPILIKDMFSFTHQNLFFNSAVYVDETGTFAASYPDVNIIGKKSALSNMPYNLREPFISAPTVASTGRLVILLAVPIFDEKRNFRGDFVGSIYLEEDNVLSRIANESWMEDGSYFWATDQEGRVIYHPDKERVGEDASQSEIVHELIQGRSGSNRISDTQGELIAGYAILPSTGWGVVSQTPIAAVKTAAVSAVKQLCIIALPIMASIVLLAWFAIGKLLLPLRRLAAHSASIMDDSVQREPLGSLPSWYMETDQIQKAMAFYTKALEREVTDLKKESLTDKLTGLANRRHVDELMEDWHEQDIPFSIALIDIDYFKKLNDKFGHAMGDKALSRLAGIMRTTAREFDVCGRYGGEEFILLMPRTDLETAYSIIENLHANLRSTPLIAGNSVTVSAGIGSFPEHSRNIKTLYALTDAALYRAKHEGRNRTVLVTRSSEIG